MENKNDDLEIVNLLVSTLKKDGIWFTQKTDPTWEDAKQYYKLDEYGDLTEGAIKQIAKEIRNYIGDGAVDIDDAIEVWKQDAFMEYKIAYIETLVTKFKDKPVVDNIEAYESQVLNESKLVESISMESLYNLISNAKSDFQISGAVHAMSYIDGGVANILSDQLKSMKKNGTDFADIKDKLLDTISANIISDEKEKVVASKEIKTENVKRRLKEENNKSQNLISDMMTSSEFDSDSNSGKIIIRTSELFNALSSKGYDVQVSFDNGESTSAILLGQQGGQIIITINDANSPLKAFSSGNFEINNDTIKIMSDVQSQIESL